MKTESKKEHDIKVFNPFEAIGYFLILFGTCVLLATFFIKETPMVPLLPGVIVNVSAGSLLDLIGVLCLRKAKKEEKMRKLSGEQV
jgi:hypothetical protein